MLSVQSLSVRSTEGRRRYKQNFGGMWKSLRAMGSIEESNQHGTGFVNMVWLKEKIRISLNGFT